jgi:hypothetical protein
MSGRLGVTGVAGLVLVFATCTGDRGPTGPQGPGGAMGAAGTAGVSGWERDSIAQAVTVNGAPITLRADCPTGKHVLGGGWSTDNPDPLLSFVQSYPSSATSWTATVASGHVINLTFSVYAICGFVT